MLSFVAPTVKAKAARPGSCVVLGSSSPRFPAETTTTMPLFTAVLVFCRVLVLIPGGLDTLKLMLMTLMLFALRFDTRSSSAAPVHDMTPLPVLVNTLAPAQRQAGATPLKPLKPSPTLG